MTANVAANSSESEVRPEELMNLAKEVLEYARSSGVSIKTQKVRGLNMNTFAISGATFRISDDHRTVEAMATQPNNEGKFLYCGMGDGQDFQVMEYQGEGKWEKYQALPLESRKNYLWHVLESARSILKPKGEISKKISAT